jgi:hypothetical protein
MITVGPEGDSNIERIVIICGIQVACKGNEAVGEIEFGIDDDEDQNFRIPCCSECLNRLNPVQDYSLDSQSDSVVD